jgi:hypothetical protein
MLQLTESITDKPDWDIKVFDNSVVAKWREEATAMPLISEPAWEWVLTEMRDKADAFKTTRRVPALDTNARCVKSDVLVSPDIRAELLAGIAPLLSVPDDQKDWHPGSNNQVLNLVHPSLFPLVYGKTRVLTTGGRVELSDVLASCGSGEVVELNHASVEDSEVWSAKFQWLPCEVEFADGAEDDVNVRITSYINNLHPAKHQGLYRTIEKLIGLSVPLWSDVVLYESSVRTPLRICTYGGEWQPAMPDFGDYSYLSSIKPENIGEVMQKAKEYLALPDRPGYNPDNEDEDPHVMLSRLERRLEQMAADPNATEWQIRGELQRLWTVVESKWTRIRYVVHPEPGQSFTYEQWKTGIQTPIVAGNGFSGQKGDDVDPLRLTLQAPNEFRDLGLQVIVKLASIELTPDKSKYPGGSWHLEGMKNEHIVATSIYYYDVENTTPSYLSFRMGAYLDEMELRYEQDDHEPLETIFDADSMREEPAIQEIGRISTPEGRILAFPNVLHHKVAPFELIDATKPGHRRFLVLWLVDPHYRICSTRNVPPQQHSWWAERGLDVVDFRPLPQELVDMVKGEIGEWPMGLEEAKALRRELMAERTHMAETVESSLTWYNLCEH